MEGATAIITRLYLTASGKGLRLGSRGVVSGRFSISSAFIGYNQLQLCSVNSRQLALINSRVASTRSRIETAESPRHTAYCSTFVLAPCCFLCLYLGFLDCSLSFLLSSVGARALALVGVPAVSDCIVNRSSQATSAFSLQRPTHMSRLSWRVKQTKLRHQRCTVLYCIY